MSNNKHAVRLGAAAAALLCLQLAAHAGGPDAESQKAPSNPLPAGVTSLSRTEYRAAVPGTGNTAETQDLLTAGLGKTGLALAAPAYANALAPTALELRRNAIHSNYRGLVDVTANGGYGRLWGPNIDLQGQDTLGEGLVPGVEYVGVLDNKEGTKRVTMAVQLPDSFNPDKPCVVVAPSSGSRGVYGAIGTVAEWGLKRGCAVALTDAGKGIGLHDLGDDSVNLIDGTRATRAAAGNLSHFGARLSQEERARFNNLFPHRVALKHAHSQLNPEQDWGRDTLVAARYALWVLNQEKGAPRAGGKPKQRFKPENTLVIAASVSNGGTAVLRAAEEDENDLIDAVVAGEPGATPEKTKGYGVQQGGVPVGAFGKPLLDYFSFANLYQPCAALASAAAMTEISFHNYMNLPTVAMGARAEARCSALAQAGLVSGSDTASRAADALARLRAYGWGPYNDTMHNAHYALGNATIVTSMYANAYGRFSVADNVCGLSFAGVDANGSPASLDASAAGAVTKATSFATANGTANGAPAVVVVNGSVGGAKRWELAVSPGTQAADLGFDAAMCLRALVTGVDGRTGKRLSATTTPTRAQSEAVQKGMQAVLAEGKQRKPTLVIAGRSDALLPVNNAARAYTAFHRSNEGKHSRLQYIEVTNAQHFDGFLGLAGFDTRYVPLHAYFLEGLDAMYAHLSAGTPLPASQVVRTTPRGGVPGAAPALTRATHLPPIAATPAAADAITFKGNVLNVPN